MGKTTKIATMTAAVAASLALATSPVMAQHAGGARGGAVGSFHGAGGVGHTGVGWRGEGWRGGWGGWRGGWGGWRGGWGGWHGWGWGCCGWRGWGWGWGWGLGPAWWGWPWYWGTSVAVVDPYYVDSYPEYGPPAGYAPPPPGAGAGAGQAPPAQSQNFNCTAWRWDAGANKYVQVPAACS